MGANIKKHYIGRISYKDYGKVCKLEIKGEDIFDLSDIIAKLDDLEITEIHISKEKEVV